MYCNLISQSYNPENTITKSYDLSPEANSGITLHFDTDRVLNYFNTPFTLDVRALTQDFILKISGVLVGWHDLIICQSGRITKA